MGRRAAQPPSQSAPGFAAELADILPDIALETLAQAAAQAKTHHYAPGDLIIRQGEAGLEFHIITAGVVAVIKAGGRGNSQVVARLGEGEYFGEIGLLQGTPRTATVRAETAVETVVLGRETFTRLVAEGDLTSREIAAVIRRRLISATLALALPRLAREEVNALWPQCEWLAFAPEATIVQQGDPSDRFYMIMRGRVDVVNAGPDGQETFLCALAEGDYFGEIGLLQGRPRNATVRAAHGPVEVITLERQDFLALMADSADTEQQLALQMVERLSQLAA